MKELHFLLYLLIFILGLELAIYSLYRYYKLNYKRLPLDKIILSIGIIYLIIVINVFLFLFAKFFISSRELEDILKTFSIMFVQINIIPLIFLVVIREFSKTINLTINYLYIIIEVSVIILSITMKNFVPLIGNVMDLITMSLIVAYFLYIFRVISRELSGEIKVRLNQVMMGVATSYFSLIFIFELFEIWISSYYLNILKYIGIFFSIFGYLMVLWGMHFFPTFYAYQWKKNLIKLFIINQKGKSIIFSSDFSEISKSEQMIKKKKYNQEMEGIQALFSGAIDGMDKILAEISNTKNENLQEIKKGDVVILLDYSEKFSHIIYALIVRNPLKSHRVFLTKIKNQFQNFYKDLLIEDFEPKKEALLFQSFNVILKQLTV